MQITHPHPRVSDSLGLGWDSSVGVLKSSQVSLMLLAKGLYLENHWSKIIIEQFTYLH